MTTQRLKSMLDHIRLLRGLMGRRNFWVVLSIDIVLILVAHVLGYLVRYDFSIAPELPRIAGLFPFLLAVKIPVFYIFGLYRGMWRYTSLTDLLNILKAICVSSGFIIMSVLYTNRFEGFSRSVFLMDGVFCFLLICAHRGVIRYVLEDGQVLKWLPSRARHRRSLRRLLLVGAGAAAEKVIREVRDNDGVPYEIVGLVDDNPSKLGLKIHGIPVMGSTEQLPEVALRTGAEEVLITVVSATGLQMKGLVETCAASGLPFKVLPSMGEIIKGRLTVSTIRDVDYKDLLGRPIVHLDQHSIGTMIKGRTILVTGAGGSIGSELCRQIIPFQPAKLVLFEASEENLYRIQMDLEHVVGFPDTVPILGRIQDGSILEEVFKKYNPSIVLHAAAYKHVPLLEMNPWQAMTNNIIASKKLFDLSLKYDTERFVLVSTDKAVRPTNVMGASKRLTELMMQSYGERAEGKTSFMAVRFGNVLGSSGSVVPFFKEQIARGGPVTVTDPGVTRYFMCVDEAAQLILQAATMGRGGEIFILKMGEPVKIADLAHDLIKLMGYEPESDIKVVFTGLRPGEKLYEELITEGEGIVTTSHDKIMVLRGNGGLDADNVKSLERLAWQNSEWNSEHIKVFLDDILDEYTPA